MKKNLVSGITGGIINFLLGWLFYGILFSDIYPEGEEMNLVFTFLGCLTSGLFTSFIFTKWAGISMPITGLQAGGIIGFFTSLSMNFFMYSSKVPNYQNMILDVVISVVIGSIVGAVIAFILGKLQ